MIARGSAPSSLLRDAAVIALLKAAVSALVLATGFRAVSDDDFARVVIAEGWAHTPRLDPSGTSWLPFPFWLTGAALLALGRSLAAARGVALLFGVAAALVVHVAARWISVDRKSALAGAALAAVFPWSARLGVATVPELPTAALTLLAIAALVPPAEDAEDAAQVAFRRRLWGSLALLAATLSRYEGWPIALCFALLCLLGARGKPFVQGAVPALLALLGPAGWIAWNRHAHGDALHFLDRVAAYRKALGGAEPGAFAQLTAYPAAALREEPELFLLLALALALSFAPELAPMRARLGRFARPAALALFQIALLCLAMVKDGAPTHHPERAVLLGFLLAALVLGDLAVAFVRTASGRVMLRVAIGAAIAGGCLRVIRPWFFRESFAPRRDEVAAGLAARTLISPREKVLVEIVDYGFMAVVASFSRPEDAVLDRSIDPRDPPARSSFEDEDALAVRASASGAGYLIGRPSAVTAKALGEPIARPGAFALWRSPFGRAKEARQEEP